MELRLVRSFVAVAEELSFSRAARRLGLSQPPLTRQIQSLEADLDRQLFRRGKRGVELTPAGKVILSEAYKLLEQSRRFVESARLATTQARPVRLACSASALTDVVPKLISAYRMLRPDASVAITECNLPSVVGDVADGQLDAAIVRIATAPDTLSMMPLLNEKIFVAVPNCHELAKSAELTLDRLQKLDLAMPSGRALPGYHAALEVAFLAAGLQPRFTHQCETINSLLGLVAAGLASTIVPRKLPPDPVEGVTFVPLKSSVTVPRLALVWRAACVDADVQALVKAAQVQFQAEPVIPSSEGVFLS